MQTKYFHKIDAQHIVEYVLGDSGDGIFVSPFHDPSSIKTYRILVSSRPDDYESEVALDYSIEKENIILQINGKADGAYSDEGVPTIELIRYSTVPVHEVSEKSDPTGWSLIRCLGFIYAEETGKRSIGLRLTAFHRSASAAVSFIATVKRSELKKDFDSLIEKYLVWVKKLRDRQNDRNVSIVNMPFPYPEKREGQDEFMIASEQVIDAAIKGFIQAPTGIGKTTGSIFPAVKALGKGTVEKIFFLTARTISRTVAEQAFEAIRKAGCKLKTLTITAKEKVCAFPENYCRPEKCPYMRGYHDRAYKAIEEMFQYDHFNRELISVYAHKFKVCPFELSLDLSLWVDGIICDYNYVFDPGVYLKRYFEEGKGEYLFLIDEAHNLVERARDMFSAVLRISRFKAVRKILRKEHVLASHDLDEVLRNFKRIMEECEEAEKILLINKKQDKDIIPAVKDFLKSLEDIMDREEHMENRDAMTDLYYDCLKYIRVSEEFDDNYVSYMGRPEEVTASSLRTPLTSSSTNT